MGRKLMASAVADSRLGILDQIIANQFDDIDLAPIMIYLVDVVQASALPWLANQFDVDGFRGFDQCGSDVSAQRELIKNAVQLHINLGTIWGIKKACLLIGFTPENIQTNIPLYEGGQNVWCAFSLEFTKNDLSNVTAESLAMLKTFINYYKNARSIFVDLSSSLKIPLSDNISLTESLVLSGGDFNDDFNDDFLNS